MNKRMADYKTYLKARYLVELIESISFLTNIINNLANPPNSTTSDYLKILYKKISTNKVAFDGFCLIVKDLKTLSIILTLIERSS